MSTNFVMQGHWAVLAMMGALAVSACSFDDNSEDVGNSQASAAVATLVPDACTAVALTSPGQGFTGTAEEPIQLNATATCTPGQTPEYQYWQKLFGADNWTRLGAYVPGSWTWLPPYKGNWCVTVVVRALGVPEGYQARSSARCGTIEPGNHAAPIAQNDVLLTSQNTTGATDVLANDFDTAPLSVTAFTQGSHGTVSFTGAAAIYQPDLDYVGVDSFSYTITDSPFGVSAAAIVNVTITP